MRKMLLYLILLLGSYSIYGQDIKYSYDLAGNCISRKFVTARQYTKPVVAPDNQNNMNDEIQIKLYPTPVKDILSVSVNTLQRSNTEHAEYTLYNLAGQILQKGNIEGGSMEINMSEYPNSVYMLKIVYRDKNAVYKVVKQ